MQTFARALLLVITSSLGAAVAWPAWAEAPANPICKPNGAGAALHQPARLFADALSRAGLLPEQKTAVEGATRRLRADETLVAQAKEAVLLALADQLARGHVDIGALRTQLASFIAAREALSQTMRATLEGIHEALGPSQRARFADALEREWKDAVELYESPAWLDAFGNSLTLSDAQKQKIRQAIDSQGPSLSAQLERFHRALTAFKGDDTSFLQVVPKQLDSVFALANALRMVQTTSKIADILTPEQRARAAEMLRHRICTPPSGSEGQAYDYPYSGGFEVM